MSLFTSRKLNLYLADIDIQACKRQDVIFEQMKQAQGITEQLKIVEWVQKMNNIKVCAMEIVDKEIFYN